MITSSQLTPEKHTLARLGNEFARALEESSLDGIKESDSACGSRRHGRGRALSP
jgi:hypothetical protein